MERPRFSGTLGHDADIDERIPSLPNSKIRSMVATKRLDRSVLDMMQPVVAASVDDPFFKVADVNGPASRMS